MPTYDYACPRCGRFEAFRTVAARNDPAACPDCETSSPRSFGGAMPALALMSDGTRRSIETNERARHEPRKSGDYARLRHPAGCGCCSTSSRRGATVTAANGAKAFPSKRPWMISH